MSYKKEQALEFIDMLAPIAQKAFNNIGKILPSICIAMAIVESNCGQSNIMKKNNALLGQKVGTGKTAKKYWSGKFFVSRTKEEYTVGTHTIIKDAFRAYDSVEQCVFNYYELLNTSLYKKVVSNVDYKTQMQQIKDCGYMTSSTEVNSVISIIEKYNLTIYDTKNDSENSIEKEINSATVYTVKKNDTLWGIASKYYGYGIKWRIIYDYNNLSSTILRVGQKLIIP